MAENRQKDPFALVLKLFLWILSLIYGTVIRTRNMMYDNKKKTISEFDFPIVSLGNLTWGGSFKTSLAIWLVKQLNPMKIAVLVRGYGSDEVAMLKESFAGTNADLFVNKDRTEELEKLDPSYELVILDDAFQHRKVARDCDVLLVNAQLGFKAKSIIPCGSLREPVKGGLKRTDMMVFTNSKESPSELIEYVQKYSPECSFFNAYYKPRCFVDLKRNEFPLDLVIEEDAACFCAIAYPKGFINTLHSIGITPKYTFTYPDHSHLSEKEFRKIEGKCIANDIHNLVITQKDKARFKYHTVLRIIILDVDVVIDEPQGLLDEVHKVIKCKKESPEVEEQSTEDDIDDNSNNITKENCDDVSDLGHS